MIFKKNGVQAMVEFDSIESATRARDNLNGCDIYSACCTLKIDYAKVRRRSDILVIAKKGKTYIENLVRTVLLEDLVRCFKHEYYNFE